MKEQTRKKLCIRQSAENIVGSLNEMIIRKVSERLGSSYPPSLHGSKRILITIDFETSIDNPWGDFAQVQAIETTRVMTPNDAIVDLFGDGK